MRDEYRYEIERALDLLPHVVGASWATIWFRLNNIKNPTEDEFRGKVIEYFTLLEPLFESLPKTDNFGAIRGYIKNRQKVEIERIRAGKNPEIEKRYERYVDYG